MTYIRIKTIIESGNYNKTDILNKLDVFLMADRITVDEYKELVHLIQGTQPTR